MTDIRIELLPSVLEALTAVGKSASLAQSRQEVGNSPEGSLAPVDEAPPGRECVAESMSKASGSEQPHLAGK